MRSICPFRILLPAKVQKYCQNRASKVKKCYLIKAFWEISANFAKQKIELNKL